MFLLVDTGNIVCYAVAILLLTPGIGIAYGPDVRRDVPCADQTTRACLCG